MALLVHFLDGAQPLCRAPHQLLGSRGAREVTCLECQERLAAEGTDRERSAGTVGNALAERRKIA